MMHSRTAQLNVLRTSTDAAARHYADCFKCVRPRFESGIYSSPAEVWDHDDVELVRLVGLLMENLE